MSKIALKLRKFKPGPIPIMLIVCFALLLILIWVSGALSQRKLEEIRLRADETTRAYIKRLKLATNISEAAVGTIARARLYRASSGLKFRGPVYTVDLNKAKVRLGKLLEEGERLWPANAQSLPTQEVEAWGKLQSVTDDFWRVIEEEERLKPEQPVGAEPTSSLPGESGDQPKEIATAGIPDKTDKPVIIDGDAFFQKRTSLEDAADNLSGVIISGLGKTMADMAELQKNAAYEVSSARWITLLLGFSVIGFTIYLMRRYINQTKQEERLKQEAQGRLRSVFDSLSDDIVVLSEQGEVVDVNQAFLKHYKLTDAELKLQDYHAALAQVPEIASFVGQTYEKDGFDQRHRERIEVKPNNGYSDSNLFDVSVSPLKVGDATQGRVVVMDDVTEDERVREELRRSRTLSAVGQITAQVAHEIYNPLGAVKLNLELLEMQIGDDEDVKHTIGRLKRGVEHLSTIIMDLRYLTRPREPEREPTDLNKLLDEVVELASDRLERFRICIVRDYSREPALGDFDPQQLRKVFLNLLINAVEASPQNGEVQLSTRIIEQQEVKDIPDFKSATGAIAVSVIDHGVGMSSETKRRLFEAFFTTKRNGTGLGMMITQEIVKKHGGKINVESEEGKGSKVNVYLPV